MTPYEKVLKLYAEKGAPITEDEFLRIYNLPREEYCAELKKMSNTDRYKDAAYTHLFVAYQKTYPDKKAEFDKKLEN